MIDSSGLRRLRGRSLASRPVFVAKYLSALALPVFIIFSVKLDSSLVQSHGTMIDPVSRNSLWRIDATAPVNYNDIELFCGGIGVSVLR